MRRISEKIISDFKAILFVLFFGANTSCSDTSEELSNLRSQIHDVDATATHHSRDRLVDICSQVGEDFSTINYDDHISHIFAGSCTSCHNSSVPGGGLNLESHDLSVLSASSPANKLGSIYSHVSVGSMPPAGSSELPACEKDILLAWINNGAPKSATDTNKTGSGLKVNICTDQGNIGSGNQRLMGKSAYANTLKDLFNMSGTTIISSELATLPDINTGNASFDSFGAEASDANVMAYFSIAEKLSLYFTTDPSQLRGLVSLHSLDTCILGSNPKQSCIDGFISGFGRIVYRRPLTAREIHEHRTIVYDIGKPSGNGVKLLIQSFLQSPYFLYLIEETGTNKSGQFSLSAHELAARMSYLAWNSMPDSELRQAADSGSLLTKSVREAQARRLLADPRARKRFQYFYQKWLSADKVPAFNYSSAFTGSTSTNNLAVAALDEFNAFVDYITWDSGGSFKDLMLSTAVIADSQEIAELYNIEQSSSVGKLNPSERAGVLTRAAMLLSGADTYSAIHRGVHIRKDVLCDSIPNPPADAETQAATAIKKLSENASIRKKTDAITSPGECKGCHTQINPLGFAFGHYDGLARYITKEKHYKDGNYIGETDIDATVIANINLPTEPKTNGAIELSKKIAHSSKGNMCMVRQMFRFTMGRNEQKQDNCQLQLIYDAMVHGDGIVDSIIKLMASDEFAKRKL